MLEQERKRVRERGGERERKIERKRGREREREKERAELPFVSLVIFSDPDLPGCSGKRILSSKSGFPVYIYRGQTLLIPYIGEVYHPDKSGFGIPVWIALDGGSGGSDSSVDCDDDQIEVDGSCTTCVAGTYMGSDDCYDCAIGTYTETSGQSSCTDCPSGTSTISTGTDNSTDCVAVCTVYLYGNAGSSSPAADVNVEDGTSITQYCSTNYLYEGSSSTSFTCDTDNYETGRSCRSIELSTANTAAFEGDTITLTCSVSSEESPGTTTSDCLFYNNNTLISGTTGTFVNRPTQVNNQSELVFMTRDWLSANQGTVFPGSAAVEFDTTEEYVKEGEALTLSCVYTLSDGYSVSNVEWYLGGSSISGANTVEGTDTSTSVYTVSSMSDSDEGDYTCEVTYFTIGSTTSDTKTVNMFSVTATSGDLDMIVNGTTTITCYAKGSATFAWSPSPDTTAVTSATTYSGYVATESVAEFTLSSTATITCTATSLDTSTSQTDDGVITATVLDVGFTAYPDDDTVEVGDAVTLSCAVDTPSDSSSFNNVSSFQWYLSGTEITSGITTTDANPTTTSELVLSSVTVSDSGQYSCVVTYGDTTTTITSTEGVLTVDGVVTDPSASTGAQGSSITITAVFKGEPDSVEWEVASLTTGASYTAVNTSLSNIEMGNLLAVTGSSNNFTVSATIYASEEPDHVTWTANGTVIVDLVTSATVSSTETVVGDDTQSTIEISTAPSETTQYECEATFTEDGNYMAGTMTTTATVTPISDTTDTGPITSYVDADINITCSVFGDEEATVSWYQDGSLNNDSSTETYDSGTTTSVLLDQTMLIPTHYISPVPTTLDSSNPNPSIFTYSPGSRLPITHQPNLQVLGSTQYSCSFAFARASVTVTSDSINVTVLSEYYSTQPTSQATNGGSATVTCILSNGLDSDLYQVGADGIGVEVDSGATEFTITAPEDGVLEEYYCLSDAALESDRIYIWNSGTCIPAPALYPVDTIRDCVSVQYYGGLQVPVSTSQYTIDYGTWANYEQSTTFVISTPTYYIHEGTFECNATTSSATLSATVAVTVLAIEWDDDNNETVSDADKTFTCWVTTTSVVSDYDIVFVEVYPNGTEATEDMTTDGSAVDSMMPYTYTMNGRG
eukprot:sb/3461327/